MLTHASRTQARTAAPTSLALADLVALTRAVAQEVHDGRHAVVIDPAKRWYTQVHGDDFVDVWLISWATEQAAELHDHGGSLGALTVVSGALTEDRWTRDGLRRRNLRAGRSVGFGLGHVHEVSNPSPTPAVSVHAYSPPLTAMSYYAVDAPAGVPAAAPLGVSIGAPVGAPRLRRTRSELVEPGSTKAIG